MISPVFSLNSLDVYSILFNSEVSSEYQLKIPQNTNIEKHS